MGAVPRKDTAAPDRVSTDVRVVGYDATRKQRSTLCLAQYNNRQRQAKGKDKNYAKRSFDVKMENNKYEQPGTEG